MNSYLTITVDDRILSVAKHFSDSSLKEILQELLQNSRRSNSEAVWIRSVVINNRYFIEVSDDGTGIFEEKVEISLGGSNWNQKLKDTESPAGCGLFSLAKRGCTINSSGKEVNLSPEVFEGKVGTNIIDVDYNQGTTITFPLTVEEQQSLGESVREVAQYFPLPVYFEGEKVTQGDFLRGSLYRREWKGVTIGVYPEEFTTLPRTLNFKGILLQQSFPVVQYLQQSFPVVQYKRGEKFYQNSYVTTIVDVNDCPDLKLVLPNRKEVVKDEFVKRLLTECERTIYQYIATLSKHDLSYADYSKAKALGVNLKEAEAKLYSWAAPVANDLTLSQKPTQLHAIKDSSSFLVVKFEEDTYTVGELQNFSHAWLTSNNKEILLEPQEAYKGYSWYNALDSVKEFCMSYSVGRQTYILENLLYDCRFNPELEGFTSYHRADAIAVKTLLDVKREELATTETRDFSTDIAFVSQTDCLDDVILVATNDLTTSHEIILNLLIKSYFQPAQGDDYGIEIQREQANALANKIINGYLYGPNVALEEEIKERVRNAVCNEMIIEAPIEITINSNGEISVSIKKSETASDEQ